MDQAAILNSESLLGLLPCGNSDPCIIIKYTEFFFFFNCWNDSPLSYWQL